MSDRVIHVIVGVICLVDHDRVFLEASNAPMAMKICALTCTSDFFQSMCTIPALVQTCIVRCALEEISKTCDACGRYKFVGPSGLFILTLLSFVSICFVFFLFSRIGFTMRLSTFMNIVA
jgi:hypothetical protein